jgi:hypothetical protein
MTDYAFDAFCFISDRLRVVTLAFVALAFWSGFTTPKPDAAPAPAVARIALPPV